MSEGTVSDLLDALGEVFLLPGSDGAGIVRAVLRAEWPSRDLRETLEEMVGHRDPGLDVTYAGLFLVPADRAPVHLEISARRSGRSRDPLVVDDLRTIFTAAGVLPDVHISMDHLGCLAMLMAHLVRRLGDLTDPGLPALERAAENLLNQHLLPLARELDQSLADFPSHPFYRAAARALRLSLEQLRPVFA